MWTLSFFLPMSRRRRCDVSILIYHHLTITLCAQIPLFILFFPLFFSLCPAVDVDADYVERGDRGSLDLTNG